MSAAGATEVSVPGALREWWQADKVSLIRLVGLTVALLSFLALWPSLIEVGGARRVIVNLAVHGYVLCWLLVATVTVRSIGSRDVLIAWLMGTFLVPTLVFVPGLPILDWLGAGSWALDVFWAPVLEETALLLAVGLLAWRTSRRAHRTGRSAGLADLIVLGWAVGSGFAVLEDSLYGRVLASRPGDTFVEAFGTTPYGALFPTFVDSVPGIYTYHAAHAAYFGAAVGIVILLRRRVGWIVWLLPAAWLYATVEHGLANHMLQEGPNAMRYLVADGHAVAWMLLLAVPAAIVWEHQRRRSTPVESPPIGPGAFRDIVRQGDGPMDIVTRWLLAARYHRTRNAAVNAAFVHHDHAPTSRGRIEAWARLAFRGMVAEPAPTGNTHGQDSGSA